MTSLTLNNGISMPQQGLGVFQIPDAAECRQSVLSALETGYRLIDTAACYGNERAVGEAVKRSGLPREAVFLTSKVWIQDAGYEKTLASFEKTLDNLGTDYLDLYLIHWPAAANQFDDWEAINRDTWRAMTELYQAGKIRAIGVSNFRPHHLKALLENEVAPMVNQIEFHPGCQQRETLAFCRDHGILVEAWSPLGRGRVLDHPVLTAIAQNHGKTPAQICLRWCLEQGVLPLPKSVTPARMAENGDLFTFALTPEDMAQIAALPPFGGSGHDPDQLDF